YVATIEYQARRLCLETKSLKFYLGAFRNEGITCESLAVRIHDDVARALELVSGDVTVTLRQKGRGGITITARALLHKNVETRDPWLRGAVGLQASTSRPSHAPAATVKASDREHRHEHRNLRTSRPDHRHGAARAHRGLRGLPRDRRPLGTPAHVHELRQ